MTWMGGCGLDRPHNGPHKGEVQFVTGLFHHYVCVSVFVFVCVCVCVCMCVCVTRGGGGKVGSHVRGNISNPTLNTWESLSQCLPASDSPVHPHPHHPTPAPGKQA